MDKRRKWMLVLLEEAFKLGVLSPEDLLRHVTPAVLATDFPPTLVAQVLQAGIDNDAFNPSLVLTTLGPQNLAEYVPLSVLWSCINEAAHTIIDEHPLSHEVRTDGAGLVMEPGVVQVDEVPDIEVLEG